MFLKTFWQMINTISSAQIRCRGGFNNEWLLLFFGCWSEVHSGSWCLWFIWVTPMLLFRQLFLTLSMTSLPACHYLFWYWTHRTFVHGSSTYIHFFYHTLLALPPSLMASKSCRCLCPLSAVCFICPDFLNASFLLFLWLQPAELNIAEASLSELEKVLLN